MKKFLWLTSLVCLCCLVSRAQQEFDSTKENTSIGEPDSLFSSFSYELRDDNKILLRWRAQVSDSDDYFIVERSDDGNSYETVGILKRSGSDNQYEVTPSSSLSGYSFYRIKYVGSSNRVFYSQALQISATKNPTIKIYPNPVDKLLIVETDHAVVMQVINALGVPRLNVQLHQGLQVIDVSILDRGTYILRIIDSDHNRNILQQLVKN
ncbi:MAG TPA: T9SS type A sorting domain-containing protein [Puia sp.]|nr:T9SS type A sorting domain-containing protein [Puia sp.]